MKKIIKFFNKVLASIILLLSLSSCKLFKSDDEIIKDNVMSFIKALENKNKEEVKSYFAKNKIKDIVNFDQSLDELFNYYQGKYMSYNYGGSAKYKDSDYNFRSINYQYPIDIKTDIEKYRMYFNWYIEYTTDKDMVGIWSFYIIKEKDDPNSTYSYWGDGLNTPGINIGKIDERDE